VSDTITERLATMRSTADLDSRAGAPVGNALLRAVAALEVAIREHRPTKTANEVELCPRCSAVTGMLVPAPCGEMRAVAAALSQDVEEAR
jgi:hypothetical protein